MIVEQEPGGPRVVHKLLHPENENRPRRTPRAVLLHTVVDAPGDTELAPYEDREDISTAVTFYIHSNLGSTLDGQIDQLLDTEVKCVASGVADEWAIAVETEDNSAGHQHDIDGLTPKALAAYIWLCKKLRRMHPTIPARRCTASTGTGAYGFGYHSQPMRERWDGIKNGVWQNRWTKWQGKTCPGDEKIEQYENDIMPAVLGEPTQEERLMVTKDDEDKIRAIVKEEALVLAIALTGSQVTDLRKEDVRGIDDLEGFIARKQEEMKLNNLKLVVNAIAAIKKEGVKLDDMSAEQIADEVVARL